MLASPCMKAITSNWSSTSTSFWRALKFALSMPLTLTSAASPSACSPCVLSVHSHMSLSPITRISDESTLY